MAEPNPRLQSILRQVNPESVGQLSTRQRDALEIVHCALVIDGMMELDADPNAAGIGLVSFRGGDYVVHPEEAVEWSAQLHKLAIISGFEDGVQGAVIVAAAIDFADQPL